MTRKDRKLILVRKDLLDEAAKITAKEGKTMFAFTNEVFRNALKAHEMQTNLREILEVYSILKLGKNIGLTIIPSTLLDYMLKSLFKSDNKDLIEEAHKCGTWFGKCLHVKFPEEEVIKTLRNIMKKYMWDSLDLSITDKGGTVELKCVSPTLSEEKTEVIFKFIQGTFEALDYRVIGNNCLRGIIHMSLEHAASEHVRSTSEKLHVSKESAVH
jgi:hypothetical protein